MKLTSYIFSIIAVIFAVFTTSCSGAYEEPALDVTRSEYVTAATVSFKLEIPQNLLDHFMVTAVWNNNAANDVEFAPVLDETFTVDYATVNKPIMLPFVLQYERNNRPIGTLVPGEITMTIHQVLVMNTGAVVETDNISKVYYSNYNDVVNVHNRTWAFKLNKNGDITFVTPENF